MGARLLCMCMAVSLWAGMVSADMARNDFVETVRPSMSPEPFGCSCPRLSARTDLLKTGREQALVGLVHVAQVPQEPKESEDPGQGEELAALGIRTEALERGLDLGEEDIPWIVIAALSEGSVAEKGGLEPGDMIARVGDRAVHSSGELARVLGSHEPGEAISLTVIRFREDISREISLQLNP